MFQFQTEITITAPIEKVWGILNDTRRLTQGFGILRIDGDIRPGARLKIWSEVSSDRAFPVRVIVFDPPRRMVWSGGMPLRMFRGERTFALASPAEGQTQFSMREVFSGPLSGLIRRSMPDLTPSFEIFASALKREAER